MAVLILTIALFLGVATPAHAQKIINPTGGTTATNGLRIAVQGNTLLQIFRSNAQQLYKYEGLNLAVGTQMYGSYVTGAIAWTQISQSAITGDGSIATPWTLVTTVGNAAGFTVKQTIRYAVSDDTFDLEIIVTPPLLNTGVVKLYHLNDTYLSGGDNGAAFWQPNSTINPPPTVPTLIGVTKTVSGTQVYEVMVAGAQPWDRYYSALYSTQYTQIVNGGNLGNNLNTTVTTDNGMGVQWTLGAITQPVTIRYRMGFSSTTTSPVCGDGVSAGFEGCDDGNLNAGDGCSPLCQLESGYQCNSASPNVCATVCGDGITAGTEVCDDGNAVSGDGCSGTCRPESGYNCTGSPSTCATVCGDRLITGAETCDDGNLVAGDGCNAVCAKEAGWTCTGAPSACTSSCGDSIIVGSETCDDGNRIAGDGCNATCSKETGWTCTGAPSSCTTTCGDALVAGGEGCDDGNVLSGDGCTSTCALETGFTCSGTAPTVCAKTCVITGPSNASTVTPGPTISGTGAPGATVVVKEGSTTVCTATVAASGVWSCASSLGVGNHTVIGVQTTSTSTTNSAANSFTVLAVPIVTINTLNSVTGANTAAFPISGTCSIGQGSVTVAVGSVTAVVACSATGTFTSTLNLSTRPEGALTATASQTNVVGTGTGTAATTKDSIALAPQVSAPSNGATVAPSPTIVGTGEPGATVTVKEGGTTICTATVDSSGNWSCGSSLGAGSHTLAVSQVDRVGNASAATPDTFTVVVTPTVTVAALGNANISNASAFPISGTCSIGQGVVSLTIGTVTASTACSASGTYATTVNLSSLDDGALTVVASQTNIAGTGTGSATGTKDTVVNAPVISAPINGSTVAPNPSISGTGEAGATVTVKQGSTIVCTAVVAASGAWSCASILTIGSHTVTATQVDTAGNTSSAASTTFTIAAVPAVTVTTPAPISSGNQAAYPVAGTCTTAAGVVSITVGTLTTTATCVGGAYSTTINASSLPDGTVAVAASQTNLTGTGTDSKNTMKDSVALAPVITGPDAGATVAANPTVSGTGEPGATVTVKEGSTVLCTATVDAAGNWSCGVTAGVGTHTITASQVDAFGNTSPTTTSGFTVVAVPVVTIAAPVKIALANQTAYPVSGTCSIGQGNVTLTAGTLTTVVPCSASGTFATTMDVRTLIDGNVALAASQTNVAGTGTADATATKDTVVLAPVITSPVDGSDVAPNPAISGTGEPGAIVTVTQGSVTLCTATASSTGQWSCPTTLSFGLHTVSATQLDTAGNLSSADTTQFTVATVPVVTVNAPAVIAAANKAAYSVAGTCTSTAGTVTLVVGSITRTVACTSGTYTTTIDVSALPDGLVDITATQTNVTGTGTDSKTATKDTVANPPVLNAPVAGSTVAAQPDLVGTGEPGATVTVKEGNTVVCTAVVDSSGNWSCNSTLGVGNHTVSLTQRDAAGNTSSATTSSFTIVAAPVVTLTTPTVINAAKQAAYPVCGTCSVGQGNVTVTVESVSVTTPCSSSGTFSTTLNVTSLAEGAVTVTVAQTNVAGTGTDNGNTSKDAIALAPVITSPIDGSTVAPSPSISGTGEVGAVVTVRENGATVCTATVDTNGNWSCTSTLGIGTHTVTASQVDQAGNGSTADTTTFDIANVPTVTVATPAPITAANQATYVVTGTCTSSAGLVSLSVGTLATSVTCAAGTYTTAINVSALPEGTVAIVAAQTNLTGTGTDSKNTTKDTIALPVVVTAPDNGATVAPNPTITGTGEPGATVTVKEGGTVVCTATVEADGTWTCASSLGAGTHTLSSTQVDPLGNVSTSTSTTFTVVTAPLVVLNNAPVIAAANQTAFPVGGSCSAGQGNVTITVGTLTVSVACSTSGTFATTIDVHSLPEGNVAITATQSNVAGTSTDNATTLKDTIALPPNLTSPVNGSEVAPNPAMSGTGEPGARVTVKEGAATVCTATVDALGNWTCASTLSFGVHSVTATQIDAAGNSSTADTSTFTVATVPVVTITTPAVIAASNATAYPIAGTCTTSAGQVHIVIGTISKNASCIGNRYSLTVNAAGLPEGQVTITATQTNVTGTGTDSKNTLKDTVALAPVITAPSDGSDVAANPTISGTGEAGATLLLREGGTVLCSTTVDISGNWSCPSTLGVGPHTVTAQQTDVAGNVSVAVNDSFTVVSIPVVTIASLATIAASNQASYPVNGTCSAGQGNVTVTVGSVTATVTCSTAGTYAATLDVHTLPDGATAVSATQTNVAGTGTDTGSATKDTIALPVVIASPVTGSSVAPNPAINGTGEVGATVTVREAGALVCTAIVDGNGLWSCNSSVGIGDHTVIATQVDGAGNTSVANSQSTTTFTIAPVPAVTVNAPPAITAGNQAAYVVSGACTTAAGVVSLTVGSINTTATCSNGSYVATVNASALPDGAVAITASQTNPTGTGTDSKNATKDTVALPPVFTAPDNGTDVAPNPTLAGTGEPGATVTVTEGGITVCTAVVNSAGSWSCATALGAGPHSLSATQTDSVGNASAAATDAFTVVGVPVVIIAAPAAIVTSNQNAYPVSGTCSVGQGNVALTVGGIAASVACSATGTFATTVNVSGLADGAVAIAAEQTNVAGTGTDSKVASKDTVADAPEVTSPAPNATVAENPTITGTGTPGATVTVKENGVVVCTAVVDSNGAWSCATTLTAGLHTIDVSQVETNGNPSPSVSVAFTVVTTPVVSITAPSVIALANQTAYPIAGTCSAGQGVVTLHVAALAAITTPCSATGTFATTADVVAVPDGDVTIIASQTNVAGTGTDSKTTSKDTVARAPVIDAPTAGSSVAANPTISGTGEPGATVTIREGSTVVCTALVDAAGNWTCASTLGVGAHTVTAKQTDIAGNTSSATTDAFTVVGVPTVTITTLAAITNSNQAAFPVSGTCSIGQGDVAITVGTATVTATCSATGTFTTTVDASGQPEGPVDVHASQTNVAGTGSATSSTLKDTVAATPVIVAPSDGSMVAPNPSVTGTGEPGATVTVRENGVVVCTAVVDMVGNWSCATTLSFGSHTITAQQVDEVGNVSTAATSTFIVANVPVVTVNQPAVINAANQAAFPITGTCTTSAGNVTVTLATITLTVPCSNGSYLATFDATPVADGQVLVEAAQTNVTGTGSDTKVTTKDAEALPPVIASPANQSTVAPNPTISGTGEPGATVSVTEGGNPVCTAVVDSVGNWSCDSTLSFGAHTVHATQADSAGNTSASSATSFEVANVPTVTVAQPDVVNAANQAAFTISGTCTTAAGTVSINIGSVHTDTSCIGGSYQVVVDLSSLADGDLLVTAAQTNVTGTGTDTKATTKDTVANPPVITGPANGSDVAANPTISGTAEPGAVVTVVEGGTVVCTATVDVAGNWSCASTLGVGDHTITATQQDAAGNTSNAATDSFTVAPVPALTLNQPPVINIDNATAVEVSGTCTTIAGDVSIIVGGVTTTAMCVNGNFLTVVDASSLADGVVVVTATQHNVAGTASDTKNTTKDTLVVPPMLTSPTDGGTAAPNPTISGTGEPGATVTVTEGGQTVCIAVVDSNGNWSCNSTLGIGTHSLTATQTDPAGNVSGPSSTTFQIAAVPIVSVATPDPITQANAAAYPITGTCTTDAGTVTVVIAGITNSVACINDRFALVVDVSAVPDGVVVISAAQTNATGTGTDTKNTVKDTVVAAPVIVSPADGSTSAPNPTISGTAEPGATVTVTEGGLVVCTAVADAAGHWSCASNLVNGGHEITVIAVDAVGNTSPSTTNRFTIEDVPRVTVNQLEVIGSGDATMVPVSGTCDTAAGVVTIVVGTVTVTAPCVDGAYSTTVDTSGLPDGNVVVHASQTNLTGTGSGAASTTKDTVANPPVITGPGNGTMWTSSPIITGTGEPGAVVTVTENGITVCTAVVTPEGTWSCASNLPAGTHTITATQTDPAHNVSGAATPVTFVIGSVKPPDQDNDGIADSSDNCPANANSDQGDEDLDGIGDVCDRDKDGDGFYDDIGVSGGGCASSNSTNAAGVLFVLIALPLMRRRRSSRRA